VTFLLKHTQIKIWRLFGKELVINIFRLFYFPSYFWPSSFSISYLFAAAVDLLGLVLVQEFPIKHHQDSKLLPWSSQV